MRFHTFTILGSISVWTVAGMVYFPLSREEYDNSIDPRRRGLPRVSAKEVNGVAVSGTKGALMTREQFDESLEKRRLDKMNQRSVDSSSEKSNSGIASFMKPSPRGVEDLDVVF